MAESIKRERKVEMVEKVIDVRPREERAGADESPHEKVWSKS